MQAVRCAECGLLTMRKTNDREPLEAEQRTRETGQPTGVTDLNPQCYAMAHRIELECVRAKETAFANNPAGGVLAVIQEPRACDQFIRWRPGRSPKEHDQMLESQLVREALEKREAADKEWRAEQDTKRKEHETQQKEADRKWQLEQKEADRKWQREQKEDDRRWQEAQEQSRREFQRKLSTTIAIAGAVVGLLGAIVGAIIRGQ